MLISSAVYWSQGSCKRAPALRPTWKWEDYAGKTQKRLFLDLCIYTIRTEVYWSFPFPHRRKRLLWNLTLLFSTSVLPVSPPNMWVFMRLSTVTLMNYYWQAGELFIWKYQNFTQLLWCSWIVVWPTLGFLGPTLLCNQKHTFILVAIYFWHILKKIDI